MRGIRGGEGAFQLWPRPRLSAEGFRGKLGFLNDSGVRILCFTAHGGLPRLSSPAVHTRPRTLRHLSAVVAKSQCQGISP